MATPPENLEMTDTDAKKYFKHVNQQCRLKKKSTGQITLLLMTKFKNGKWVGFLRN